MHVSLAAMRWFHCCVLVAVALAEPIVNRRPATNADGVTLVQTVLAGQLVEAELSTFGTLSPVASIPRNDRNTSVSLAVAREIVMIERAEFERLWLRRLSVELDALDGFSGAAHVPRVFDAELAICKPAAPAAWALFMVYLGVWVFASLIFSFRADGDSTGKVERSTIGSSHTRAGGWDKARSLLMVFVIATHWIGKWGVQRTMAGWVFLNWAFSFHGIGFVVLSGVFAARYAAKIRDLGLAGYRQLIWGCADLFLVYVAFSWLRGSIFLYMMHSEVSSIALVVDTLRGTFLFHQGPWYLAALVLWRCCTPMLYSVGHAKITGPLSPVLLMAASLAAAWLCPYRWLGMHTDPFAAREALHYLPYFAAGLLLGQDRLEALATCCGRWTPWLALCFLAGLATIIYWPLAWIFLDEDLRWTMLKKDIPSARAGGPVMMLGLYAAKLVASLAALISFAAPWHPAFGAVERSFERTGAQSLAVYVLHMVFIMVPGEALCVQGLIDVKTASGPVLVAILLALAVAVNLLCGSDFSNIVFKPFLQPMVLWPHVFRAAKSAWQPLEKSRPC